MTVPGVPDIYQGTELWDFSLVDPDNRRPVEYEHRRQLLKELQDQISTAGVDLQALAHELLAQRVDGQVKLYMIHRLLCLRRDYTSLFRVGSYTPVASVGGKAHHFCAFTREYRRGHYAGGCPPAWLSRLMADPATTPLGMEVWGDTRIILPQVEGRQEYRNVFTGETITRADATAELALGEK